MSKPNPTDMRDTEIYAKVIDKNRSVTIDNGASPIERTDLPGPSAQDVQPQVPDDLSSIDHQWAGIFTGTSLGSLVPVSELEFVEGATRFGIRHSEHSIRMNHTYTNLFGSYLRVFDADEIRLRFLDIEPCDDGRDGFRTDMNANEFEEIHDMDVRSSMSPQIDEERWVRAHNDGMEGGRGPDGNSAIYIPIDDLEVPPEWPGASYQNIPVDIHNNAVPDGWDLDGEETELEDHVLQATEVWIVSEDEVPQ